MQRILVIGSLNADLETEVARFPKPGETLLGGPLRVSCGGKGNNQAVAAARLGAKVTMLGAVGEDNFGHMLLENLKKNNVNTDSIFIRKDKPSATALITRTHKDNHIIVTDGANNTLRPKDILAAQSLVERNDVLLLQQEIPLETQITAIEIGYQLGKLVVLNPAPVRPLPDEIIRKTSYLLPNEHEILALGKNANETIEEIILQSEIPIVMTWGDKGILYKGTDNKIVHKPAYTVTPMDTTGAGDTFCSAFCCFLSQGFEIALQKALQASALSVTHFGAQGGMPTLEELEAYSFS